MRSYNISPSEAYDKWKNAVANYDERVGEIINLIIKANPEGLPVIINRNPTINFGSILQVYCIGFTKTLTMSICQENRKSSRITSTACLQETPCFVPVMRTS